MSAVVDWSLVHEFTARLRSYAPEHISYVLTRHEVPKDLISKDGYGFIPKQYNMRTRKYNKARHFPLPLYKRAGADAFMYAVRVQDRYYREIPLYAYSMFKEISESVPVCRTDRSEAITNMVIEALLVSAADQRTDTVLMSWRSIEHFILKQHRDRVSRTSIGKALVRLNDDPKSGFEVLKWGTTDGAQLPTQIRIEFSEEVRQAAKAPETHFNAMNWLARYSDTLESVQAFWDARRAERRQRARDHEAKETRERNERIWKSVVFDSFGRQRVDLLHYSAIKNSLLIETSLEEYGSKKESEPSDTFLCEESDSGSRNSRRKSKYDRTHVLFAHKETGEVVYDTSNDPLDDLIEATKPGLIADCPDDDEELAFRWKYRKSQWRIDGRKRLKRERYLPKDVLDSYTVVPDVEHDLWLDSVLDEIRGD